MRTVEIQITPSKPVIAYFGGGDFFDVSVDGKTVMLRSLQISRAEEVRRRLAQLGVEEQDVAAAISSAHEPW